jgi:signal transduction histidine kinase
MDLRALFEEAVGQVAPQAQAKGIHVDVEISPDLAAWVDAGSIERALVNLLGNVVKLTLRGGRVEMCRQEDGRSDPSGCG